MHNEEHEYIYSTKLTRTDVWYCLDKLRDSISNLSLYVSELDYVENQELLENIVNTVEAATKHIDNFID